MTKPLALVVYENLLPGSQLINRLQDLGYRVQTLACLGDIGGQAVQEKPLLIIIDLSSSAGDPCAAIRELKANAATAHIPILAFSGPKHVSLHTAAHEAGATLVANEAAVLAQLPELLEQLLHVD